MFAIDMTRNPTEDELDAAYKLAWREAVAHKGSDAYGNNPDALWRSAYCTQVARAFEDAATALINQQQGKERDRDLAQAKLNVSCRESPPHDAAALEPGGAAGGQDRNAARRAEKARAAEDAAKLKEEHEAAIAQAEAIRAKYDLQAGVRDLVARFGAWMAPFNEALARIDPRLIELARPFENKAAENLKGALAGIQAAESAVQAVLGGVPSAQAALGGERAAPGLAAPAAGIPLTNLLEEETQDA